MIKFNFGNYLNEPKEGMLSKAFRYSFAIVFLLMALGKGIHYLYLQTPHAQVNLLEQVRTLDKEIKVWSDMLEEQEMLNRQETSDTARAYRQEKIDVIREQLEAMQKARDVAASRLRPQQTTLQEYR